MASIYPRKDSAFLWLKYRDASGKLKSVSTKFKKGIAPDVRKARQLAAQKTVEELSYDPIQKSAGGWDWVAEFFQIKYATKDTTRERYVSAWPTVRLFLEDKKIWGPRNLERAHCFDYVTWRKQPDKKIGKYRACHNTALLELKILRIVMQEAVERKMVQANPVLRLGIPKEARKLKPELTDEHCEMIRQEIAKVQDKAVRTMLENSFEIARYQGCRLKETRIDPFKDVDLKHQTITFRAKGGKTFNTALHPKLVPLFERLRAEGKKETWTSPDETWRQWASTKWTKFFIDTGLKARIGEAACFHSTRVTVVTRLARGDVPISKAKSYVGHASTLIHETYQRLNADDVKGCTDAIG